MAEKETKVVDLHELCAAYEKEQKENGANIPESLHAIGYHNGLTMAKAIALKLASDGAAVVRCQKCRFWKRHTKVDREFGGCLRCGMTKHENGFCDLGKVKTTDNAEGEYEADL